MVASGMEEVRVGLIGHDGVGVQGGLGSDTCDCNESNKGEIEYS